MQPTMTMTRQSNAMRQCIQDCLDCYRSCYETVPYCSSMGGAHAEADHLRRLADCSDLCRTTAQFMMRGSDWHGKVCAVCAEICERCAEDCERFGDDTQMRACADACRRCAQSCREMARR